jgi:F-type H+-transporting ATPase subunit b
MLNIDLSALVTVLYLIIIYVFLSRFFFGPLVRVMHQRRELIDGRLDQAHQRMAQAEQKAAEYENALKNARSEVYKIQETNRERALGEKADLVTQAKAEADKAVQEGRQRIAAEASSARQNLLGEVDNLARNLKTSILRNE